MGEGVLTTDPPCARKQGGEEAVEEIVNDQKGAENKSKCKWMRIFFFFLKNLNIIKLKMMSLKITSNEILPFLYFATLTDPLL